MMQYFDIALFTLIVALFGSVLVLRHFPRWGLLDNPGKFGYERKPVPYSAGLVLYVAFFLGALFFLDWDKQLAAVMLAATILVGVSFWDDRRNLSPYLRLLLQLLVVVIVVSSGTYINGVNIPLAGWLSFGEIGGQIVTGVWLMALINVVNWLDGVPGLASGVSGIAFLTIFALSVLPQIHTLPQAGTSTISLILGVASLVTLAFGWPRLRYLLGDTGSMFLGLMLGVVSVYSGGKVATAALVLFLPLFDFGWTIVRRVWSGKSPFRGDTKHLHHRLQKLGIASRKLVGYYLLVTILVAVGALFLLTTDLKGMVALILLVILLVFATVIVTLENRYGSDRGN